MGVFTGTHTHTEYILIYVHDQIMKSENTVSSSYSQDRVLSKKPWNATLTVVLFRGLGY